MLLISVNNTFWEVEKVTVFLFIRCAVELLTKPQQEVVKWYTAYEVNKKKLMLFPSGKITLTQNSLPALFLKRFWPRLQLQPLVMILMWFRTVSRSWWCSEDLWDLIEFYFSKLRKSGHYPAPNATSARRASAGKCGVICYGALL